MDEDVFFDDFFGAATSGSGLTEEQSLQLAAAAALADRLPETRTAKLDRDLAHAGSAAEYRADVSGLVTTAMLPANFAQLQIDADGQVSSVDSGGASAAEIWDYFVAATGDAAVDRIAAATGGISASSFRVAVTVEDQTGTPVMFARVAFAGSAMVRYTDQFGQVVLYAEAGSYDLIVQPPFGFHAVAPQPVSVVDSDQSITVVAQRELPAVTVAPGACAVTLQVIDQTGTPLPDLEVSHKISAGFAVLEDHWMVNAAAPVVTNAEGIAQLVAARGQVYDFTVRVSDSNLVTIRRLVPDAESATLSMMVEA